MAAGTKTLAQQLAALARLPATTAVTTKGERLSWRGRVQPTPLSDTYALHIGYAPHRRTPEVTVLSPDLRSPGVETLPHVYKGDVLCLHYFWQWDDTKLVARTIVPWASEWLLHYELWKATNTWRGGGHEPA